MSITEIELERAKAERERLRRQRDALAEALDPDTLEAIASELTDFKDSARADSLRLLAKKARAALAGLSRRKAKLRIFRWNLHTLP